MKFEEWLNTPIDWFGSPRLRRSCINEFVTRGLYPWVITKGYHFNVSSRTLQNFLANGLYDNRNKSCIESDWSYYDRAADWIVEEKTHFYDVLHLDSWDTFWEAWSNWTDVSSDSNYGQDRRIDIQEFIWNYLDLKNSRQTQILMDILYEEEDESPRKQTNDVYLQEAVEFNGWAGYRH